MTGKLLSAEERLRQLLASFLGPDDILARELLSGIDALTESLGEAERQRNETHSQVAEMVHYLQPGHHCPDAWALRDAIALLRAQLKEAQAVRSQLQREQDAAIARAEAAEAKVGEFEANDGSWHAAAIINNSRTEFALKKQLEAEAEVKELEAALAEFQVTRSTGRQWIGQIRDLESENTRLRGLLEKTVWRWAKDALSETPEPEASKPSQENAKATTTIDEGKLWAAYAAATKSMPYTIRHPSPLESEPGSNWFRAFREVLLGIPKPEKKS